MSTRYKLFSPAGAEIIGMSEVILCVAYADCFTAEGVPEYVGESKIYWDTQEAADLKNPRYVCANGEEWTFDQLTAVSFHYDDEEASA